MFRSFTPTPPEGDLHELAGLLVGSIPLPRLSPTEVKQLSKSADKQFVGPLLYWQLDRMGTDLTTPEWETLRAVQSSQVRRYLQRKAAFQRIDASLAQADIPAVWLKGFTLAHTVYPNPALRPMRDLDVLVPAADKERALARVCALGYTLSTAPLFEGMQAVWHHYHLAGTVAIELHYDLFRLRSKILPSEQFAWFWSQTRRIQSADIQFTAFTAEAELLYLSAHAILQHGESYFLLQRFLDLHLLIVKNSMLNWRLLVTQAVELRWTFAVRRALEITRDYFGTPVPEGILYELEARRLPDEDRADVFFVPPGATRLQVTRNFMRAMNRSEQWKWVWGSLFPARAYMRWRYPIRAVWQLPLFYLYRWWIITSDSFRTMLKWLGRK